MLVIEHGGDTMLPRIGIKRALHPGETVRTTRKKRAKKYRIVSGREGYRVPRPMPSALRARCKPRPMGALPQSGVCAG
jgi:hypothetical protein